MTAGRDLRTRMRKAQELLVDTFLENRAVREAARRTMSHARKLRAQSVYARTLRRITHA